MAVAQVIQLDNGKKIPVLSKLPKGKTLGDVVPDDVLAAAGLSHDPAPDTSFVQSDNTVPMQDAGVGQPGDKAPTAPGDTSEMQWGLPKDVLDTISEAPSLLPGLNKGIAAGLDLAYRGAIQTPQYLFDKAASGLDAISKATGLADALSYDGNQFLPGSALGALAEAFPAAGAETGIVHPVVPKLTPEQTALVQDAYKTGSVDQIQKTLADVGLQTSDPELLAKYVADRDAGKPTAPTVTITGEASKPAPDTPEFDQIPQRPLNREQIANVKKQYLETLANKQQNQLHPDEVVPPRTPEELAAAEAEQTPATTPLDEAAPNAEPTPEATPEEPVEQVNIKDVTDRLTNALKTAGKANAEQRALYTQARSERLKGVVAARNSTGGEAGLNAELSQLSGELPKVDFQGVKETFTQPEVDALFDHIKNHPNLGLYSSITARKGLAKLLSGQLPTTSEIDTLGKAMPKSFVKAALKHRSGWDKIVNNASNVLNVPRSFMSTFDLSAPFRQGLFMAGRKEFWKAMPEMFKAFGSEKSYKAIMDNIHNDPRYPLMDDSGLAIADMGHDISKREERFQSNIAEDIPFIGKGVRMSDRAYTGFLNKLRADTFNSLYDKFKSSGYNVEDPELLKGISSYINTFTGRGSLGEKMNQAAPLLNGLFFSPRLIASRVNILNPIYYAKLPKPVRLEAVKSLASTGALALTLLGIMKEAGADVETDPRSADFAKIKSGHTRYDILGGEQQYIRLAAELATNSNKSLSGNVHTLGKGYGTPTGLDVVNRFVRSKLSPVASIVADAMARSDMVGNPITVKSELANHMLPLFAQDLYDVVKDNPGSFGIAKGVAKSVPGVFGVGIQTYDPAKTALNRIVNADAPDEFKVRGLDAPIALSKLDKENYKTLVNGYLENGLNDLKSDPMWEQLSDDDKVKATQSIAKDARAWAKETMINDMTSGSGNGS